MQKLAIEYLLKTKDSFPDKIAIVDEEHSITFIELWGRSLALAYWIATEFQITHQPISVNIPKSIEAIIGLLAIQLSGNIYVPFDIDTPLERKDKMLKTLNSDWVLDHTPGEFILAGKSFSDSDTNNNREQEKYALKKLSAKKPDDPLYIIFTSGTTGTPKGVTISNASVIDYIDWAIETYEITESEIIGNQAPLFFDNSVLDLYLTFAQGCTLHLLPKNIFRFPAGFGDYVSHHKINFIFFVPSLLGNLVALKIFRDYNLTCLKKVLFAGEVMPLNTLKALGKELPLALLSNLYGPTEITVDAIYWVFGDELDQLEHVPLGVPCANHRILFLDENEKSVPDENEPAEICVAGPGVALGYWNDLETTRQVFIPDPGNPNEIIYKTGDLGYRSSKDGLIYMTGRKDDQFKHSGYRIEPGEIENAMNRLQGIQQSCVLYDPEKKLIQAFYTTDELRLPPDFQNLLRDQLPSYMIPHRFHWLENFPTTANGKINRRAIASVKK